MGRSRKWGMVDNKDWKYEPPTFEQCSGCDNVQKRGLLRARPCCPDSRYKPVEFCTATERAFLDRVRELGEYYEHDGIGEHGIHFGYKFSSYPDSLSYPFFKGTGINPKELVNKNE
jgi:hypothetical protein